MSRREWSGLFFRFIEGLLGWGIFYTLAGVFLGFVAYGALGWIIDAFQNLGRTLKIARRMGLKRKLAPEDMT